MDAARISRTTALATFLGLAVLAGVDLPGAEASPAPVATIGPIVVLEPDPVGRDLIRWALAHYEAGGLDLPPTAVRFHEEDEGCSGLLGTAVVGRIDLCVRMAMEPGPQRIVLHELAHVWAAANLSPATQEDFLSLRGLDAWGDAEDPWKERGREQAAEIIAWGLDADAMLPMIVGNREPAALSEAFRLLTGRSPFARTP